MKDLLAKYVRARLGDDVGKALAKDSKGNSVMVDCKIYTDEQIETYLDMSLARLNQELRADRVSFDDQEKVVENTDLLVQGAVVIALARQALVERGREMNFTDKGVDFHPPPLADLIMTQWQTELHCYENKLRTSAFEFMPA